ncbi:unnamed protein product [Trichogramma brassicae]|uniref:Uncharacterized protein n=1 Tax=Trichogramma brassicae TaxID=86971 RepID=A0A6H5IXH3_9HYME|nr:unnamed protein product [Trichogramma brassicae]
MRSNRSTKLEKQTRSRSRSRRSRRRSSSITDREITDLCRPLPPVSRRCPRIIITADDETAARPVRPVRPDNSVNPVGSYTIPTSSSRLPVSLEMAKPIPVRGLPSDTVCFPISDEYRPPPRTNISPPLHIIPIPSIYIVRKVTPNTNWSSMARSSQHSMPIANVTSSGSASSSFSDSRTLRPASSRRFAPYEVHPRPSSQPVVVDFVSSSYVQPRRQPSHPPGYNASATSTCSPMLRRFPTNDISELAQNFNDLRMETSPSNSRKLI